jgi:uncharacterized protein (DUF58 family)
MHTNSTRKDHPSSIDPDTLQALGVLMPIRLSPLKFLPGRHPLGRAGSGLRFLRTRPFQQGEDNPRDIDKFSSPGDRQVIEWEEESQAAISLLADVSSSMDVPYKTALRNACLMQLTYSLWRAGDRVGTIFFGSSLHHEIKAANLKTQMERLSLALSSIKIENSTDISSVLRQYTHQLNRRMPDIVFLVSDFVSLQKNPFRMDAEWQHVLQQLQNNLIPVVITFELPVGIRGMLKIWDPERHARSLTWFSSARIRQINREERERVSELVSNFRKVGLDYLVISNQRQIYPQLAQLARIRRRRKN